MWSSCFIWATICHLQADLTLFLSYSSTFRFTQLGNPQRSLSTADPQRDSRLPSDEENFDQGVKLQASNMICILIRILTIARIYQMRAFPCRQPLISRWGCLRGCAKLRISSDLCCAIIEIELNRRHLRLGSMTMKNIGNLTKLSMLCLTYPMWKVRLDEPQCALKRLFVTGMLVSLPFRIVNHSSISLHISHFKSNLMQWSYRSS